MRRLQEAAIALVLLLASLGFAGLLAEAAVRLTMGEQVKFPRRVVGAPFGVRINEPNARYRHQSPDVTVWLRINGQGMRADRDFAYGKPAGTERIVVIGDSFTVGYEVACEETFASVLEDRLRTHSLAVEVLNAGVSGFGNAEAAVYLERELLRYGPDVVILAFFGNDLVDNVRSGLFRLESNTLTEAARVYVPGGRLANFLNTNPLFNFLSERSDAFSLLKERATVIAKRQMVKANLEDLARGDQGADLAGKTVGYRERLTGAILDRIHQTTSVRGIHLIIMSIPRRQHDPLRLTEQFPFETFDIERPAFSFLATKPLLDPWLGKELLYWDHSDDHWTPFSHRIAGEALAQLVLDRALESRGMRH